MRHSRPIYFSIFISLVDLLVPVHAQSTITSTATIFSTTTPSEIPFSIFAISDTTSFTTPTDIPISIAVNPSSSSSSSSSPTTDPPSSSLSSSSSSTTASATLALFTGDANYQVAGCYEDVFAGILPDPGILPITPPNSITVPKCLEAAANVVGNGRTQTGSPRRGTQYLTIANGRDCIGISTLPHTLHSLPSSFCGSPCLGDTTTSCGGPTLNISLLYARPVDIPSILANTIPLNGTTPTPIDATPTFDKPANSVKVGVWIGIAFGLTALLIIVVGLLTWEQKRYNKKHGVSKFPKGAWGQKKGGLENEMRKHGIANADLMDDDDDDEGPGVPGGGVFMRGAVGGAAHHNLGDRDVEKDPIRGNGDVISFGTGDSSRDKRDISERNNWNEKSTLGAIGTGAKGNRKGKEREVEPTYGDLEFTTGVPASPTTASKNFSIPPVLRSGCPHPGPKSNNVDRGRENWPLEGSGGTDGSDGGGISERVGSERMGRERRDTFEQWKSGVVPPLRDEPMPSRKWDRDGEMLGMEGLMRVEKHGNGNENGDGNGKQREMEEVARTTTMAIPTISISSPPASPIPTPKSDPVNNTHSPTSLSSPGMSMVTPRPAIRNFERFADPKRGSGMWGGMMGVSGLDGESGSKGKQKDDDVKDGE